jgi:hypothetical protein
LRDDDELSRWFDELAARLERAGFSGTIRPVRRAEGPDWYGGAYTDPSDPQRRIPYPPLATAFVRWSIDLDAMTADPGRTSHWHVPAHATDRIAGHLADWTSPGGARILLSRDAFSFRIDDPTTVAPIFADTALATGMTSVLRYETKHEHGRAVQTTPGGETVIQAIDDARDWRWTIDVLRDAITTVPDLADQAFIRPAPRGAIEWSTMELKQPLPSGITEIDVRYNRHLLDRYVPDAHGIQVLRDEHLANATDLSNWVITDLGAGRHLVEAPDLAPWYAGELPDPATVERARIDFGPMILTKATIAANPPPWKR